MPVIYKLMRKEHIKAVSQIERECFSNAWSENAFYDELENPMSLTIVAVFTYDGSEALSKSNTETVAGFVNTRIINDEVYINNIAVSKVFRQMGVGKGLMMSLERAAREKQASFITLEVRESNLPAISLYTSLGYNTVGKRKKFYRDPEENAVLMTKNLI